MIIKLKNPGDKWNIFLGGEDKGERKRERCKRGIYSRNIAKIPLYVND